MKLPEPSTDDLRSSVAVVDTCVLADVFSCHDLIEAIRVTKCEDDNVRYRRARVQESMILIEYLHRKRLATFSLRDELWKVFERNVPADPVSEKTEFPKIAFDFLAQNIWRDWTPVVQDPDWGEEPSNNKADDALIEIARRYAIPLITNEGYGRDGTLDRRNRMRKRCIASGVDVVSPKAFWDKKIDPRSAERRIRRSFDKREDRFILGHPNVSAARYMMQIVRNYLGYVLPEKSPGLLSPPSPTTEPESKS